MTIEGFAANNAILDLLGINTEDRDSIMGVDIRLRGGERPKVTVHWHMPSVVAIEVITEQRKFELRESF